MSIVFVLAVICLPITLLSLQVDAQPTADFETTSCSSTELQEVAQQIKDEIKDVKQLLASNPVLQDSAEQPSKQALVSALACEYIVWSILSLSQ